MGWVHLDVLVWIDVCFFDGMVNFMCKVVTFLI